MSDHCSEDSCLARCGIKIFAMPLTLALQMGDLKRVIDEDQRTYVQWAEEKLSLANIAADLLIQHRTAVDKDVGALLAELKVTYHLFNDLCLLYDDREPKPSCFR